MFGAIDGDVKITAGKDVTLSAAELIAGDNIDITGRNVNITASEHDTRHTETHEFKQSGLTLGFTAPGLTIVKDVNESVDWDEWGQVLPLPISPIARLHLRTIPSGLLTL